MMPIGSTGTLPIFIRTIASAAVALVLISLSLSPAFAHGGEDHGDAKPIAASGIGPRLATGSDDFEIVALPSAKDGGKLRLFLSDASSNRLVTGAKVSVTLGSATAKATEISGGYELAASWVLQPGKYDLTFDIGAGDRSDLLIGTLDIPPAHGAARHDSVWDHVFPDQRTAHWPWVFAAAAGVALLIVLALPRGHVPARGSIVILLGVIATASAGLGAAVVSRGAAVSLPAAAVLDQADTARRLDDGAVFVPRLTQTLLEVATQRARKAETAQKTVRLLGQVIPDLNRSGLVQSLVPGRIEAPDNGLSGIGVRVKAGDVLGYLVPRVEFKDQSDIQQTSGDLDRQIALAESKLARIGPLKGIVAESQISDARIELEGLRKRRAAIRPLIPDRQALVAPVDGVVAQANVVAGQAVDAQAVLFQIVDPDNLWVEALAYDPVVASSIERVAKDSVARTSDGREAPLIFSGRAMTLKQQAVPLRFKLKGGAFSVGEPVTVLAPIDEAISAIPLPRSALVRSGNGQSVVYVHTGPERFEAKTVTSEPIDADRIGITGGIEAQARVVIRGAELINQIR